MNKLQNSPGEGNRRPVCARVHVCVIQVGFKSRGSGSRARVPTHGTNVYTKNDREEQTREK